MEINSIVDMISKYLFSLLSYGCHWVPNGHNTIILISKPRQKKYGLQNFDKKI